MKTLRYAMFVACTLGLSQSAFGVNSSIQMSGNECYAQFSPDEAALTRLTSSGLNGGALVTCPLSQASDDTNYTIVPEFTSATVFFQGSAPNYCYLAAIATTGSHMYSANFTINTSTATLTTAFDTNADTGVALVCSLPVNAALLGFTTFNRVSDIAGGT